MSIGPSALMLLVFLVGLTAIVAGYGLQLWIEHDGAKKR
jgi:hypothetical protein